MLGLDPCQAAPGRLYDYLLGGKDNFAADRELGEKLAAAAPHSRWIVRENRAFVERAVTYYAERVSRSAAAGRGAAPVAGPLSWLP